MQFFFASRSLMLKYKGVEDWVPATPPSSRAAACTMQSGWNTLFIIKNPLTRQNGREKNEQVSEI